METEDSTDTSELDKMLLDFTIKVLQDDPQDLISYAADYFTQLRDEQQPKRVTICEKDEVLGDDLEEDLHESEEKILASRRIERRGTVMGEQYNPEEDTDEEEEDVEITPKTDEERKRIKQNTKEIFLFRALDDEDLDAVIDAMVKKDVEKGEVIIKEGEDGDFFYLIDNGDFDIFQDRDGDEKPIGTYDGNGFFGELALLHNQPRAATIKAASDGLIWAVGRKTFNKLIVKRAFQKRMMYMELLNEVDHLKPLTVNERLQVADALSAKSYHEGDAIVHEGDKGDGMYFIVEGKVSVRRKKVTDEKSQDVEISQLSKGEYFGELALLKKKPRAASVVALEDTKAAFLEVSAFERLLGPCMDIIKRHGETYI